MNDRDHHNEIACAIRELADAVRQQASQEDIAALKALLNRAERIARRYQAIRNVLAALDAET